MGLRKLSLMLVMIRLVGSNCAAVPKAHVIAIGEMDFHQMAQDVGEPAGDDGPHSECPPPIWECNLIPVSFQPDNDQRLISSIRGRAGDVANDAEEPEE
jgi:hypothetical protein